MNGAPIFTTMSMSATSSAPLNAMPISGENSFNARARISCGSRDA